MLIMSTGTGSIRVSHMACISVLPIPVTMFRTLPSSVPIRLEPHHGCCNAATNGNGERDRHKGNPHFALPFADVGRPRLLTSEMAPPVVANCFGTRTYAGRPDVPGKANCTVIP